MIAPGKKVNERYVLTYYGTGMTPMYEYFDNEDDAIKAYDDGLENPMKSVSTLKYEKTLRSKW